MIFYPKVYGTCAGSARAITLAIKTKEKNKDKKVYIYKEILHNPYVIKLLEEKGIYTIDDLNILNKNDILIIRAHGETKETFDYLNKHNITYYDATCTNVLKVHDLVIDKYNQNYNIIIVGKKTHPEVIGTNSFANNTSIIIETKDDYKLLDKSKKYYIVCQTTTSIDNLKDLINYMQKNNYNFEYTNTICNQQKLIQDSSTSLAKKMDMMIVIGGKNSSNTKELFNECNKVCKSYYFSDIKDFYKFIKETKITNKMKIGFTGGASTTKDEIKDYSNLLKFYIYYKNKYKDLSKKIDNFNSKINKNNNKIVNEAIDYLIKMNQDGKFIRGTLINLGYKLNHNDESSDYLSVAYETFETSILIHDDIIDNASIRRGKETIHKSYNNEFKNYNKEETTSSSLALCIGDLGFFLTNNLILEKYKSNKNIVKLLHYYNDIVINTIKGEIIDVYLPFKEEFDSSNILEENDIMEIYRLKTSWYTIVGPFILGMILGNSSQKLINEFEQTLEPLGIAFQIKDDILGIFSDNKVIGKSTLSDIEEFKQTILYSYIKINKKDYYKELIKYYGRKDLDSTDQLEVQNIIKESGSLEYAQNKMNEMFKLTKDRLNNLTIKEEIKDILFGLIKYLELREK